MTRLVSCSLHPGSWRSCRAGQSMLEYAVLIATVAVALVALTDYVSRAFNTEAGNIEDELSGGTVEEK